MVIDYQIRANDKDITDKIKEHLISLSITDTVGDHADGFNIRLSDYENALEFPTESSKLRVLLGYKNNLQDFGTFFVDTISYRYPPSVLDITANSVPFVDSTVYTAMQTQRSRSFDDITVAELVNKIAVEHGLESVVNPKIGAIKITHIDQTDEGNISFLRRVVRLYGGTLKPTHSKLIVLGRQNGNNALAIIFIP